jgi:hypothetical protein
MTLGWIAMALSVMLAVAAVIVARTAARQRTEVRPALQKAPRRRPTGLDRSKPGWGAVEPVVRHVDRGDILSGQRGDSRVPLFDLQAARGRSEPALRRRRLDLPQLAGVVILIVLGVMVVLEYQSGEPDPYGDHPTFDEESESEWDPDFEPTTPDGGAATATPGPPIEFVTMPSFLGSEAVDAETALTEAGFTDIDIVPTEWTFPAPPGHCEVVDQYPPAGASLDTNEAVYVYYYLDPASGEACL